LWQKNGNRHSGNATKSGRCSVATEQSVWERKNIRVVQGRQTIRTGTSSWPNAQNTWLFSFGFICAKVKVNMEAASPICEPSGRAHLEEVRHASF
jgi:hypothetical protein